MHCVALLSLLNGIPQMQPYIWGESRVGQLCSCLEGSSYSQVVCRMVLGYVTHCRAQNRCIELNSSLCSLCQAVQPVSNFDKIRVIAGPSQITQAGSILNQRISRFLFLTRWCACGFSSITLSYECSVHSAYLQILDHRIVLQAGTFNRLISRFAKHPHSWYYTS